MSDVTGEESKVVTSEASSEDCKREDHRNKLIIVRASIVTKTLRNTLSGLQYFKPRL